MIAAGGICDGCGMAAAFALGAEGIQMGTRFVSCTESPVHANYKNAIIDASETGTLVLNKKSTPCIRALKSQRTRAIHDQGLMAPEALKGIREVYFHGEMEAAPALAGQSAGLIDAVKSAQQITRGSRGAVLCHHRQARRAGNGEGIWVSCTDAACLIAPAGSAS